MRLVDVGDAVTVDYEGQPGRGRVEAVRAGRVLVRLTVRTAAAWTSPVTGGTVPAGCPLTYLLWLPVGMVSAGSSAACPGRPSPDPR